MGEGDKWEREGREREREERGEREKGERKDTIGHGISKKKSESSRFDG